MRLNLFFAVAGLTLAIAGTALADDDYGGYESSASGSSYVYTPSSNSSAPIYNSEPMIAGKNAPSYTSPKNTQPYSFDSQTNSSAFSGMMTPEQATAARALREQQALQAQQQYLADMQRTGGMPVDSASLQERLNQYNPLQEEEPKPKKRRVIYNQRNNETAIGVPPRLFDPDQR